MRKTAVIYARVSTAKQAAEELPIASQIDQCRAKAAALGADVLHVFEDRGISGRDEDRPGFQDAISFSEREGCDYFITWSTSRFARDAVVAGIYKRRLDKRGVELAYCTADIDRNTTSGFILDSVLSMIDEVYSRQISADTLRSLMNNARAGHWNGGSIPFGFETAPSASDPRRKRLVPKPDEAWLVQMIFRRCAEGSGPLTIAHALNEMAYLHRGRVWSAAAVSFVLDSPAVIGITRFNKRASRNSSASLKARGEWIEVRSHEPLVDQALWDVVHTARLAVRKPRKRSSPLSTHLFTGILTCGHCGAQMHVETATGRSATYSYYNCHSWLSSKTCANRRRRAEQLDEWLVMEVTTKVFTPGVMREVAAELNKSCGQWATQHRRQLQSIEKEMADIALRRRRLVDVLELQGRDAPNLGDISSRLQELREQESALRAARDEALTQPVPEFGVIDGEIESLRDSLTEIVKDRSDIKRSREMLRQLLENVVLHSDRAEISYRTDLLANRGQHVVPVHSTRSWLPE